MNKTLNFSDLVIEITRKCNMKCKHCLRGDSQNIDIDLSYIDKLFEHTQDIYCLSITGGEPTLNIKAIKHIIKSAKQHNVEIHSFFLATNGKKITKTFVHTLLDLYYICSEYDRDDASCVCISQDKYHENIQQKNEDLLKPLSFYSETAKTTDFEQISLIKMGRAKNLSNATQPYRYGISIERNDETSYHIDGNTTLTSTGYILPECDYEYAETEKIAIGHATKMNDFIKYIKEKHHEQINCL